MEHRRVKTAPLGITWSLIDIVSDAWHIALFPQLDVVHTRAASFFGLLADHKVLQCDGTEYFVDSTAYLCPDIPCSARVGART